MARAQLLYVPLRILEDQVSGFRVVVEPSVAHEVDDVKCAFRLLPHTRVQVIGVASASTSTRTALRSIRGRNTLWINDRS